MSITFTPLGTTLEANIIDGNFEAWQDLFRSGLQGQDFNGKFDRFRVQRWQAGQIKSVQTGAIPFRTDRDTTLEGLNTIFDLTYRRGVEVGKTYAQVQDRVNSGPRSAYAMELLGRPGPSFYFQYQEDELPPPSFYSASDWPPDYWPIDRYPRQFCYSRWLTFPYASARVYVPYPCLARISASSFGSMTAFQAIAENAAMYAADEEGTYKIWQLVMNAYYSALRVGLVVDTNPKLYGDEFANTNPYVVNPLTGSTAGFCSWKVIRERTIAAEQRQKFHLRGEVALKGGRWYNFSFKFRDPAHHGWLDWSTDPPTWKDDRWEDHMRLVGDPLVANEPFTRGLLASSFFQPPWINLWETATIGVEFIYGRVQSGIDDWSDDEFQTKAPNPW